MPFTKTIDTRSFRPRPEPLVPGAEKQHIAQQLREISLSITALNNAVKEMQDFLETLP